MMSNNFFIVIAVAFAFLVSFLTFFIFQNSVETDYSFRKAEFFETNFPIDEKKIFLVGASHIGQLNTTHIQLILDNNGYSNFKVYNIAIAGDKPEKRLQQLESLVGLKPELVVYGLGYRDFQHWPSNKPVLLPDIEELIHDRLSLSMLGYDSNPKFMTLSAIKVNERTLLAENAPFFEEAADLLTIKTDEEFKQIIEKNPLQQYEIKPFSKNPNALALKRILDKFDEKEIKSVIVLTPHHEYFLESVNQSNDEIFRDVISQSTSQHTKIYDFREKYVGLNVWGDLTHIAFNDKALIFSDDMAEVILENLG
jgi:hypothetical protein